MSHYEKQLSEEVERRKLRTYDSFQLSDDKKTLLPSYGTLPYTDTYGLGGIIRADADADAAVSGCENSEFRFRSSSRSRSSDDLVLVAGSSDSNSQSWGRAVDAYHKENKNRNIKFGEKMVRKKIQYLIFNTIQ